MLVDSVTVIPGLKIAGLYKDGRGSPIDKDGEEWQLWIHYMSNGCDRHIVDTRPARTIQILCLVTVQERGRDMLAFGMSERAARPRVARPTRQNVGAQETH